LCGHLGIPDGLVSAASINDHAVEASATLNDGDKVGLFPPSAGG
jgi:molybdopterin converting factor small subunit